MIALRLWWRLARRQEDGRLALALAVIAFATATGALLTVLGGLGAFMKRGDDVVYVMLAQVASVILVVPVITLGGAAARLAVSRRDERLANLRLAGATTTQVSTMAVADAAAQALIGALAGVVLYLVALPGIAMINFQGRPFDWSELWVGFDVLAGAVAGVVVLASLSAVLGLAKVSLTPLGVTRRVSPKRLTWMRLVVAVLALIAWTPVFMSRQGTEITMILIMFGICFGVLNLLGPFVLGLIGRSRAKRARSVETLLAGRRLADDPKSAWRTVGGVALATFVAGVVSVAPAMSVSFGGDAAGQHLPVDIMTGAVLTLVIAALLAAVSSGVTQTARLLDQRDQYRMLHLAGTDLAVLERARMRETWLPLVSSVMIAAITAVIIVAPVGIQLLLTNSVGLWMFVGGVAASLALVMGAVRLSQPMVATVAGADRR